MLRNTSIDEGILLDDRYLNAHGNRIVKYRDLFQMFSGSSVKKRDVHSLHVLIVKKLLKSF